MSLLEEIPVVIYAEEGMTLPTSGTYYVVAGNGVFLHKDMPSVRGFVQVENVSVLPDLKTGNLLESKMPKVPAKHVVKIKEFFRRVVEEHRSEACTVLYYNAQTNDWKIHVSEQRASHGGVSYDRRSQAATNPEYEGYLCVGTIHSHCDFTAFHSGTDVSDENDFDGIHGTFGHNHMEEFTVSASVVINGARIKVEPLTVFEGLTKVESPAGDVYTLSAPKEHREMMEQGVEDWVALVNRKPGLHVGDIVEWVGEATHIRKEFGDGPFTIFSIVDDRIMLEDHKGWFSKTLFKKV